MAWFSLQMLKESRVCLAGSGSAPADKRNRIEMDGSTTESQRTQSSLNSFARHLQSFKLTHYQLSREFEFAAYAQCVMIYALCVNDRRLSSETLRPLRPQAALPGDDIDSDWNRFWRVAGFGVAGLVAQGCLHQVFSGGGIEVRA